MASAEHASWAQQLQSERALLAKAEIDVEEGWRRVRNQQELLDWLQQAGHDTEQAERLVNLLKRTLVEWERHRTLIVQRVAYLEDQLTSH
ncbi:lysyl-tRNA synthetase class II [Bradyrhizobium embrapense]